VSVVGALVVAVLGAPGWHLTGPMLVVGAGVGLLVPDLRERCMLGDTGSNVLGAAVGWGLVISLAGTGEWVALGLVVGLNVVSEFVSFSRVIDAVAPLRWLDRWGALPERRQYQSTIRAVSGGPSI
jgi:UDP-N-acetylmuramyl pentapeptide phosphotransferase/UDP-N-acetylglucosamine-1-phosphate transferase